MRAVCVCAVVLVCVSLPVPAGINGQQEQQANGCLLQSHAPGTSQPHTPPSNIKSSSRLGSQQDQQQQRQATPPLLHSQQQQQHASSQAMLLDLAQHPGVDSLLSLVQSDKFGSREAAAVWADGQTVPTVMQVRTVCYTYAPRFPFAPFIGRADCQGIAISYTDARTQSPCSWRPHLMCLFQHNNTNFSQPRRHNPSLCRPNLPIFNPQHPQALCPPQADGTSSRLQAWLQCSQLAWLLQAAGALLAYAEGRPEAPELQVRKRLAGQLLCVLRIYVHSRNAAYSRFASVAAS